MKYISTRGKAPKLNFEEVLLTGLASDAGLYVPETLPKFTMEEITKMSTMEYTDLAYLIISPFIGDCIPEKDLKFIIKDTYKIFRHKAVAPIKQLDHQEFLLELFHGPTLAFKDFALQLLGKLLDYFLKKRNKHVTIIGATSGDTGSAAIEGCKNCSNVSMFIFHPKGRVSDVQRKQMTTVDSPNIFNLAIEADFDDCQDMVKEMFKNQDFLNGKSNLVAVNSINWTRIMAQIIYYFYTATALGGPLKPMAFSVPTGNFGDIFAGYIAKQMGLPIKQLIIATNHNDIMHRFISNNIYSKNKIKPSISPSMDIQIASNFERLLFDLYDRDGDKVEDIMIKFRNEPVSIEGARFDKARKVFDSYSVNDDLTCEVIKQVYHETGEILDPHTAIGVKAARECRRDYEIPMITLATAHPSKFPEAILRAGLPAPELPYHLKDLMDRKERFSVMAHDLNKIKEFIASNNFAPK